MNAIRPELAQEVLRLMVEDGLRLTDDLNQCERAILGWVRRAGAAALEAHLGGKKTGIRRVEPGLRMRGESEVRRPPG